MADHRNDDDLDDLLDSALDDFHSLNLNNRDKDDAESAVQGLGKGLPDLKLKQKKKKTKGKAKETAVSEALDKLREQTREAVKGLDSVTSPAEPNMEDWVKQFEELASSQDMESIMETMMQQLLSKEILHEPMKEIGEKYPKWLADHEASVTKEEYDRFLRQYELIKALNVVYEKEPNNFNKIVELMQRMQECGQPPSDILTDLSPDFDLSALSQISPEMLGSDPNCCIM